MRTVLPVNLHGRALVSTQPGAPPPSELMLQTLSNLKDASHLLWVPFGVAYVFCAYTCWLLRLHFRVQPCSPTTLLWRCDTLKTKLVAITHVCHDGYMDNTMPSRY